MNIILVNIELLFEFFFFYLININTNIYYLFIFFFFYFQYINSRFGRIVCIYIINYKNILIIFNINHIYINLLLLLLILNEKSFLNEVDRVLVDDFIPTKDDVLFCRIMTTKILETKIVISRIIFK